MLNDGPHCAGVGGEIIGAHEWDIGTHVFGDVCDGFAIGGANDFADFRAIEGALYGVADEGEVAELSDIFSGETLAATSGGDYGEDGKDSVHVLGLIGKQAGRSRWIIVPLG
jgi:hypothetical protein